MTSPINAVFFTNETASPKWRINGIADRANQQTPHGIYVIPWRAWNNRLPEGTNLVIMELLTSEGMVEKCHELGAKVIWEADDALLDTYGKERKNLMHLGEGHREATIKTLQTVDAITVTNERLKENYARFTDKPIYILPNYIDFNWYGTEDLNIERNSDEVRIGWFGSKGHLEDLEMITPALNEVLEKYPQAKFVYCGFGGMSSDKKMTRIGWGEDVFKDIPRDRREFHIGIKEEFWPMKHRFLDFDIGIAPLVEDEFNWNKTPIKWMEYGILGTPSVCSPTLYGDYIEHKKDGFIATDHEDWVTYLSQLVEDAKLRKRIGAAAKAKMQNEYNLDNHWQEWLEVYTQTVLG